MRKSPQRPQFSLRPSKYVFRGCTYQIKWRKPRRQAKTCGGTCQQPWTKNCTIEIHPALRNRNLLRVLIDESIHACHWDLDNDCVAQTSHAIAGFLWECGVRFPQDALPKKKKNPLPP